MFEKRMGHAAVAALAAVLVGSAGVGRAAEAGALDTAFGSGGSVTLGTAGRTLDALDEAIGSDGRITVISRDRNGSTEGTLLARFGADGTLDGTFGAAGPRPGVVELSLSGTTAIAGGAVAVGSDGSTYAATVLLGPSYTGALGLWKLTPTGAEDPQFNGGQPVTTDLGCSSGVDTVAMVVDASGRPVLAGSCAMAHNHPFVARFTTTGALDPAFASGHAELLTINGAADSVATGLALGPGGTLLIGGEDGSGGFVARLTDAGVLDSTYDPGGAQPGIEVVHPAGLTVGDVERLAVDSAGRALVAFNDTTNSSHIRMGVARITAAGQLDTAFAADGPTPGLRVLDLPDTAHANGIAIQPDDRVLLAGSEGATGARRIAVARLTTDGALDPSFGPSSPVPGTVTTQVGTDDYARSARIAPDGGIVAAGAALEGDRVLALSRYLPAAVSPPPPPATPAITTGEADASVATHATVALTFDGVGSTSRLGFTYQAVAESGAALPGEGVLSATVDPAEGSGHFTRQTVLRELLPDTTYRYQAYAVLPDGSTITGAQRTFHTAGARGQLAFLCQTGRFLVNAICIVNDDGSNFHVFTSAQVGQYTSYWAPRFSPDGTRIAYELMFDAKGTGAAAPFAQLFVAPVDGGPPTLVDSRVDTWYPPAWDPSGQRIAYYRYVASAQHGLEVDPRVFDLSTGAPATELVSPPVPCALDSCPGLWWDAPSSGPELLSASHWCPNGVCGTFITAVTPATPRPGDASQDRGRVLEGPDKQDGGWSSVSDTDPAGDDANDQVVFQRADGSQYPTRVEIALTSAIPPAVSKGTASPVGQGNSGPAPIIAHPNPVTVISDPRYQDYVPSFGLDSHEQEAVYFLSDEASGGLAVWSMDPTGAHRRLVSYVGGTHAPLLVSAPSWWGDPCVGFHCAPQTCPAGEACRHDSYQLDRDALKWSVVRSSGDPYQDKVVDFTNASKSEVTFAEPSVAPAGAGFSVLGASAATARAAGGRPCAHATLAPGERCAITVRFDTRTPGTLHATLSLRETGDPTATVALDATGTGFAPRLRALSVASTGRAVRFRLSAPAHVAVSLWRAVPCRARRRALCPALPTAGSSAPGAPPVFPRPLVVLRRGPARAGTVRLPASVHGRRLRPGAYIVTAVATAARGWRSPPRHAVIRVRRAGRR